MRYKILYIIMFIICAAVSLLCSCAKDNTSDERITKDIYAMDTYMSLSVCEGGKDVDEEGVLMLAKEEIERIEKCVSAHASDSELAILNEKKNASFSEDAMTILEKGLEVCEMTDGAFNPAIYPVMEAWGFTTKEYKVPGTAELEEKLSYLDVNGIDIDKKDEQMLVTIPEYMKLDFGGIAKGYASDRIINLFRENGIKSAIVSLGGNVKALGTKPDGTLWRTAIKHPEGKEYIGVVDIADKAVITSGGYERFFEENGQTYHHIIDPATGYPAKSGVTSVTIVSDDGMLADGLSTALFVMGLEKSTVLWREHHDMFDFVIMTDDGSIHVTEGLKDSFTSSYEYEIIH